MGDAELKWLKIATREIKAAKDLLLILNKNNINYTYIGDVSQMLVIKENSTVSFGISLYNSYAPAIQIPLCSLMESSDYYNPDDDGGFLWDDLIYPVLDYNIFKFQKMEIHEVIEHYENDNLFQLSTMFDVSGLLKFFNMFNNPSTIVEFFDAALNTRIAGIQLAIKDTTK